LAAAQSHGEPLRSQHATMARMRSCESCANQNEPLRVARWVMRPTQRFMWLSHDA
jgi:hypothetical protein